MSSSVGAKYWKGSRLHRFNRGSTAGVHGPLPGSAGDDGSMAGGAWISSDDYKMRRVVPGYVALPDRSLC
jgi:hypothetical protein